LVGGYIVILEVPVPKNRLEQCADALISYFFVSRQHTCLKLAIR